MDKQKIINVLAGAIKEYGNSLTNYMEHPDDYRAFVVNFNSVDCAKRCAKILSRTGLFPDREPGDLADTGRRELGRCHLCRKMIYRHSDGSQFTEEATGCLINLTAAKEKNIRV